MARETKGNGIVTHKYLEYLSKGNICTQKPSWGAIKDSGRHQFDVRNDGSSKKWREKGKQE